MNTIQNKINIVFLGASGAVGTIVLNTLIDQMNIGRLVLLGRKKIPISASVDIKHHIVDISDARSYATYIESEETAICTLGVGEPSKINKDEFVIIDKTAVLDFAKTCKEKGVKDFQLLSSVSISSKSTNFFLRTKGELVDELIKLNFERLSIFQPSMILTPKNRYGISQAIILKVWPKLNFLLVGKLRKYRGMDINILGTAIANNINTLGSKIEYLEYDQIRALVTNYIKR